MPVRRVDRAGGAVLVAAISRWAPRLHRMLVDHGHVQHPVLAAVVDDVERNGTMPPLYDTSFNGDAHNPGRAPRRGPGR